MGVRLLLQTEQSLRFDQREKRALSEPQVLSNTGMTGSHPTPSAPTRTPHSFI